MQYFLFAIYFLLLAYLLKKNAIIRSSGFSNFTLLLLFILKICAGIAIGWMSAKYYSQGNDYWTLQRESLLEYDLLIHHPKKFITDLFYSPYNNYGGFFDSVGSYWNDLKNNIIIKILAVLNIFSRGDYYINSLFLNTFSFIGTVALASVFFRITKNKLASVAACFLIPSTVYFSSGIHKDLFVFTMIGFLIYAIYFLLTGERRWKMWMLLFISIGVLLLMRNIVVLMLIPAMLFLYLNSVKRLTVLKSILFSFLICAVVLTGLHFTYADPLKMVVQKQKDFLDLGNAYSQLPLQKLEPNFSSFIHVTPQAANHAFLRPYLWEYPGHFLMLMSIELYLILSIILLSLFKIKNQHSAFFLFTFLFGILMIFIAGYIVPNTGSLVRYRSLYYPLILNLPLAALVKRKLITY